MFKEASRRFKQQILQGVGAVEGTNDDDFKRQYSKYKKACYCLQNMRKSIQRHSEATRFYFHTTSMLMSDLENFEADMPGQSVVKELIDLYNEARLVQLSSMERLLKEDFVSKIEGELSRLPEIEERVRERKKFILDYDSHIRRYDSLSKSELVNMASSFSSSFALNDGSSDPPNPDKLNMGKGKKLLKFPSKRKNQELIDDLAHRKARVAESEEKMEVSTKWLVEYFNAFEEKRVSGAMMERPIAAFLASNLHMSRILSARLEKIGSQCNLTYGMVSLANFDKLYPGVHGSDKVGNRLSDSCFSAVEHDQAKETVFGMKLSSTVPRILSDCIDYILDFGIETEGVFRLTGSFSSVESLKQRYDSGENIILSSVDDITVHDVCTLLKQWLRQLQEPLIPPDFYRPLLTTAVNDINLEDKNTIDNIMSLTATIPRNNLCALAVLAAMLHEVASRNEINQMTPHNLATCLAPSIFIAPIDLDGSIAVSDIGPAIACMKVYIVNADELQRTALKE